MQIKNILVVCIGNICRSPMAEFFLKQQHPDLHIESAGISAMVGHNADSKAIHCMDQIQIDMRTHIAKQINSDLIKKSDLILVMSHNQQKHIENSLPFAKGKVFRLGHWQGKNVPDPYQHDQAFFEDTCHNIQSYVADWQKHLKI
ncbi:low molecular weight protein-tyrosine-phosphatase [Acinetobacter sp. ANC 4648]|uniref:low molecular weight protein-tyrosine-phosphatase n=1 Tax=Acinetobacter sp. ANC 4648 TaxID=1977875 RepID=UPI000A33CB81|nr:low molecular weight protein-tyrosine-phosphatase [Acinetobacter sp. ANC 4648]OTG85183.1 protein tyrosine phosphatase [Acinetobacter sp. ANC 4648]